MEVAELLSSGRSNSAIADALSLSARTVEAHVATLFNKFDVHSRTELAQRLRVGGPPERSNLTSRRKPLIGRKAELSFLSSALPNERLVTITGSAGVGKTLVAQHAGVEALPAFSDGVWLVECAPLRDTKQIASAILADTHKYAGRDGDALAELCAHLRERRLLVVLDNCEHIIAAAAEIAETLLRGCPHLHILATSREPLKIAGEQVHRLDPLLEEDAIDLFSARARAANHRFERTAENGSVIGDICRRLDRVPLAIEFAAARANVLSLNAIAERVDHRLALLATGERVRDHRHQTMRALIDWSYDLLSPAEQHLFEHLSVFAGGSTLPMIAATQCVCTDGVDAFQALSSLVDKSLVVADVGENETRYRLLESTREYAREKLLERGHHASAAHSHAIAYLQLAERLVNAWAAGADQSWGVAAKAELANWRAALSWTLSDGNAVMLGQQLAAALRLVWMNFGYAEGRQWIRAGLARVEPTTPLAIVAALELADAQIASGLGELEAALAAALSALEKSAQAGDRLGKARAQQLAGRALTNLGRVTEAEPFLNDALALTFEAEGAARLHGVVLESLGHVRSAQGKFDEARAFFAEALTTFNALGADMSAAIVALSLAEAEFRAGDCNGALRYAGIALARSNSIRNEYLVAYALSNMAAYQIRIDRFDEARTCALAVIDHALNLQNHLLVWAIQHVAAIATLRPQRDSARAARLLGFVDTRLPAPRQFTEQQEYERTLTALRDYLAPDELRREMLIGRAFSEDDAVGEARAEAL